MRRIAVVAAMLAAVAVTGVALATPSGGITDVISFAQGRTTEKVHANPDGVRLKTKGRVDVVFQTLTFQPGGTSGWHSHSGIVIISVKSGVLTRYDRKCRAVSYGAGDSFVEHGDHPLLVRNEGTEPAVIYLAFVLPDANLRRITSRTRAAPCSDGR
jgi:quercetin dioxygenase-like cupin family protein